MSGHVRLDVASYERIKIFEGIERSTTHWIFKKNLMATATSSVLSVSENLRV